MKIWISIAIIVGMIVVGGLGVSAVVASDKEEVKGTIDCPNYNNGCTAQKNCGQANCEARTGGGCGCGR